MRFLPVGAPVEFYVFEDDAGLGAEECSVTEGCLDGSSWFSGLVWHGFQHLKRICLAAPKERQREQGMGVGSRLGYGKRLGYASLGHGKRLGHGKGLGWQGWMGWWQGWVGWWQERLGFWQRTAVQSTLGLRSNLGRFFHLQLRTQTINLELCLTWSHHSLLAGGKGKSTSKGGKGESLVSKRQINSRCSCRFMHFILLYYIWFSKISRNTSTPVLRSSGKDRKGQLSSSNCSHVLFNFHEACVFVVLTEGPKGEGKGESKGANACTVDV